MKYVSVLWPVWACLVCPVFAQTEPLVYQRFENSTAGEIKSHIRIVQDVVGYGGLSAVNHHSGQFDGKPATGISYGTSKQVTSTDFTVEAFVKLSERGDYAAIAADWNEEGNNRCWAFVVTPRAGLRFDVSSDGSFQPGNKLESPARLIEPSRWYHVAAVSQGQTSRIYVNGRQVAKSQRGAWHFYRRHREPDDR